MKELDAHMWSLACNWYAVPDGTNNEKQQAHKTKPRKKSGAHHIEYAMHGAILCVVGATHFGTNDRMNVRSIEKICSYTHTHTQSYGQNAIKVCFLSIK